MLSLRNLFEEYHLVGPLPTYFSSQPKTSLCQNSELFAFKIQ